jgi:hypothetical protein
MQKSCVVRLMTSFRTEIVVGLLVVRSGLWAGQVTRVTTGDYGGHVSSSPCHYRLSPVIPSVTLPPSPLPLYADAY